MTSAKLLTIAGSDSLAGGGLQSDLATFSELNVFGLAAVTAVVSIGKDEVQTDALPVEFLKHQLASIGHVEDLAAIKVGFLADLEQAEVVAEFLQAHPNLPIVLDPVLSLKEGSLAENERLLDFYRQHLLPGVTVITPNVGELALLANQAVGDYGQAQRAAKQLMATAGPAIWLTIGERFKRAFPEDLFLSESSTVAFGQDKLSEPIYNNGAGCTFSAALAVNLAKGMPVLKAGIIAQDFVHAAIRKGVPLGAYYAGGSVWPAGHRFN
ncbi:bifunctional hydroxymethylpyrimidine kinase/phosphomethylpyrimidine kinase [Eupransor demetentiae]|uniref:pyridoxal kinase n=1 Tax=Eupransor demetentiae TaxID=3109584 RepID=A0ABM9N3V1_9LACO|nr:Hydroxymethylpyrimidine/phosphomethylpyrimidine kinase (ThiD) [Lactobacillaceae bacterium LMG 33000]